MSGYLPEEPNTFINIKLTDTGRRLLSLGQLTFDKAAFSDREITYDIDNSVIDAYDISNNRILAPKDDNPTFVNFDGTDYMTLGQQAVSTLRQTVSAMTDSVGFFTGSTKEFFGYDKYKFKSTVIFPYSSTTSVPDGGNTIDYLPGDVAGDGVNVGDLIYIPWRPLQSTNDNFAPDFFANDVNNPTVQLWYRIMEDNGTTLTLDRKLPNFGTGNTGTQTVRGYVYPYNAIEDYYGSAYTKSVQVWNMNIVRTSSVIGTKTTDTDYVTYGSIEYNGSKTYFGLGKETKEFGVIHYTNNYTGNTYAEQFVAGTVEINIPNVMWHKTVADIGQGISYGIDLYDAAGSDIIDPANNSTYRELRDGTAETNEVVGRVYHKLKIVLITHPELLTALTYKSNRNYTLPKPFLATNTVPKYPLTTSDATGLCEDGKTYFVTYRTLTNGSYDASSDFGYPETMPCASVSKISGATDANGNPTYLTVNFPANSFPYLRSSAGITTYSGTGWNSNAIQILVNEVDNSSNYDFDSVPTTGWVAVSNGVGNGIYTGDTGDVTIDPLKLQGYQFVISREDVTSGTTYTLPDTFKENNDLSSSGMTFGSESFLFGNFKSSIAAISFKTAITVMATNQQFNSSTNPTFNSDFNKETYITEIGIFNNNNELVAVGKPTYPIRKSDGRFLAFKLEYDF